MEFQFNERERAFRDEIDAFVHEWLPPDWPEKIRRWPGGYGALEIEGREEKDIAQRFKQKLVEKGWATISWPKAYGGREYSNMEQAIFDERMSYYQAPVISIATVSGILMPVVDDPNLLGITFLMTWALGVTYSPLSGMHLAMQGRYGINAFGFLRWNAGYVAFMLLVDGGALYAYSALT